MTWISAHLLPRASFSTAAFDEFVCPSSSTALLRAHYATVAIRVVSQRVQRFADRIPGQCAFGPCALSREILMETGLEPNTPQLQPVMYAKAWFSPDAAKKLAVLRYRRQEPLGAYLFQRPAWQRSPFIFKYLRPHDPEYPRVLDGQAYWARYSVFHQARSGCVGLLEIFLSHPLVPHTESSVLL